MPMSQRAIPAQPMERGYVLAAVIIMLAVMMIALATAIPKVREDIQRDKEQETMQRAHQYVRGIQLYYRKFRHYPVSVDNLEDTNALRFLRQRYPDPLTGQDDWVPVLQGANKAPLSMGFFGQSLNMGAAVMTGSPNGGANNIIGASPLPVSQMQTAFGPTAFGNSSQSGTASGNGSSNASMPFAGGPIIGFSPANTEASIRIYKTKDHYDEWEFVYDPAADPMVRGMMPVAPTTPPVNVGAPGFGPPGGTPVSSPPSRP